MMQFDLPKDHSSIIKVIGVGGGGSNAVNHMYKLGIKGVDFMVCNTDQQALDTSPVPIKIQLGATLTEGRGAGSVPEVGKNSAIENIEEVKAILAKNTKMIFITAGMGGGTGTGAAPVIAKAAKEMGILTVAIVTIPFSFEGKKRKAQAEEGLAELKANVDTLLIICNDKLREIYGNKKITEAFAHADDVLATAAKAIAEIITITLHINTDFADIQTVMKESGVAIMGSADASGEGRAVKAVEQALNSPLLNDNNIKGARYVLLNITCGKEEITMDELGEITDYIQDAAGQTADLIKGYGIDESLGDKVNVTIIATGFNSKNELGYRTAKKPEIKKIDLHEEIQPTGDSSNEFKNETPKIITNEIPFEKKEDVKPENKDEEIVEPYLQFELKTVEEKNPIEAETTPTAEEVIEPPVVEEIVPIIHDTPSTNEAAEETSVQKKEEVEKINVETTVGETHATQEAVSEVTEEASFTAEETPIIEKVEEKKSTIAETVAETPLMEDVVEEAAQEIPEINNETEEMPEPFLFVKESEQLSIDIPIENKAENIKVKNETPEIKEEVKKLGEIPVLKIGKSLYKSEEDEVMKSFIKKEEPVKKEIIVESGPNEEQKKKALERIQRLKELSMKLKTPNGLTELENEPAYKRKNVTLQNVNPSSESEISRFTLSENEEKKVEIKPNNSFLHDNVD